MTMKAHLSDEEIAAVSLAAEKYGFNVQTRINAGAVGVVLKATDRNGSTCALKVLAGPFDLQWLNRFRKEAELLTKLDHPGLVKVLPPGLMQLANFHAFATEFVDGTSLRKWLDERGTLSEIEAIKLVRNVCQVVQFVHSARIIHRDLHAGNVMLENNDLNRVRVLDFGTAREIPMAAVIDTGGYKTFRPIGSMSHCSPEKWISPHTAQEESDIFSLGVLLYNALTLQFPFWSDSYVKLFELIKKGDHKNIRTVAPHLSKPFGEIVTAMIDPSRLYRIGSMSELDAHLVKLS